MKEATVSEASSCQDAFRLEEFLPFRLSIASEAVARLIGSHHLSRSGLSMSEWRLLAAIGRFGVMSPTAAGERTSMDKVKVSRAAAGLVSRGLVKQTQDPDDGRGRLLRLTRKGTAAFAEVARTAGEIDSVLSAGLTRTEWNALYKSLAKLSDHARMQISNSTEAANT